MTVKELIEYLESWCDPNATVLYDAAPAVVNEGYTVLDENGDEIDPTELIFGIDDVLRGEGVLRGSVYLSEDDAE